MKQPPIEGAAVLDSYNGSRRELNSVSKIAKPTPKDNQQVIKAARNLATLYRSSTNGSQCFTKVYNALAAKYDSDRRRLFHRVFREAVQ